MRLPCAAVLVLSLCVAACNKKPQGTAATPAEQIAEITKSFDEQFAALEKRLPSAPAAERRLILKQAQQLVSTTSDKLADLADGNPTDGTSLDAAVFVVEKMSMVKLGGPSVEKASAVLIDHHLTSPKLRPALGKLARAGDAGERILKAVAEKTADRQVKALSQFHRGVAIGLRIEHEEDELAARSRAEAISLVEAAANDAPDAKVGADTLAAAAAKELEGLKLAPGFPMPAVEGRTVDGRTIDLSSFRGRVVLLDVWATWCMPCVRMIPHERRMVAKLKGKPFTILSVCCDADKDELAAFLGREAMPWDHWWDGARGPVATKLRVKSFPTLYLIDAAGVIRNKWVAAPPDAVLEKAVEAVLGPGI